MIKKSLLQWTNRLKNSSQTAQLDAEVLLAHVLGKPRAWLRAHGDESLSEKVLQEVEQLIQRRLQGEPIAYLTGTQEFWSLPLRVTPDVLIPRPETELLVELTLALLPKDKSCTVADWGTGSGAIALALAHEQPHWHITGLDSSRDALQIAADNANALGLANITWVDSDWGCELKESMFDAIVSNPPYIAPDDSHLQGSIRFEPQSALVAAENGLACLRAITTVAPNHLQKGGWLLLEHGASQGDAVRGLLQAAGFTHIKTHLDLAGLERVSVGRI